MEFPIDWSNDIARRNAFAWLIRSRVIGASGRSLACAALGVLEACAREALDLRHPNPVRIRLHDGVFQARALRGHTADKRKRWHTLMTPFDVYQRANDLLRRCVALTSHLDSNI